MLTLWGGCNTHKQGQQWRRLKSKCSHYLKWARFVGGGTCRLIFTGVFIFERNVTLTHTHRSPSLSVRGILMCQRCGGTVRFPHQMAWRLWGQQAGICNAAQPVWMSANVSHQLPLTWDIKWYLTYPVAVLIQVAISFLKWNMICLFLGDNCCAELTRE